MSILFQPGQRINYDNGTATVISSNSYSNTITISYNGEIITVDRNDLFGMNRDVSSTSDPINRMVEGMREDIAKREEKIGIANKVWNECSEKIRKLNRYLNSLLSNNGAVSAKQLQGDTQAQYYAALEEKRSAKSSQLRASADVMNLSISNFCDILSIGKFENFA